MNYTNARSSVSTHSALKKLTVSAVLAALTTVMTAYICHVPVGMHGGYVHFGDAIIYIAAAILPLPYACAVGAIGGGMADLLTAPMWTLPTLIIKMLICLPFTCKCSKFINRRNLIALAVAFLISGIGYYIAEGIMYGFQASLFTSMSGSIVQSGGSAVIYILLGAALDKMNFKTSVVNDLS